MKTTEQTGLNNFIKESIVEEKNVEKSPLEMIAELKTRKYGPNWGYKDDPRPNRRRRI